MWSGVIAILPSIGWYVTSAQSAFQSLRVTPNSSVPSVLAGSALLFIVIMLIANAFAHSRWERLFSRQTAKQETVASGTSSTQFKNVDEFYKIYSSRMLNETEELVKKEAEQYQPGQDREKYLMRVAAMLTTVLIFEKAWLTIYGSQLKLLQDLNIGGVKTYEQVRNYYDQAVVAHPDHYKTVSFDAWVSYLKTWILVRDYDPTHLEITVRRQDFLRYLLEMRYDHALRLG